jgi:TatD DNase family protein
MIDAHTHIARGETRNFICEPFSSEKGANDVAFYGVHPWDYAEWDGGERLRTALAADLSAGVGEIGLDRMKDRNIPRAMRDVFASQLEIAADFTRSVVLHGAKCWGEVVKACKPYRDRIPAFLFHGFSRSGGLLPDIEALNGFVSVGPAVLNDHAVNYRELVKSIPDKMILVESDATAGNANEQPSVADIARRTAEIRGVDFESFAALIENNAARFLSLGMDNSK